MMGHKMGDAKYNSVILEAAGQHLGVEEWPGSKHNPVIMAYFEAAGHSWVDGDETPWCAGFANAVLAEVGLVGTGKLNARSFMDWGQPVALANVKPGDVVVFWRGSPSSWQGHVGFVVRFEGGRVICRGGNQSNKVSDAGYPMSRVLGFRRADGGRSDDLRPVLRRGSRGAFVMDLQQQLFDLRYFASARDGDLGSLTESAVMKFQAANGLEVDGVVGRKTWEALGTASPAPMRNATEDDLRKHGSQQIASADSVEKVVKRGVLTAGGLSGLDIGLGAATKLNAASDALTASDSLIRENWLPLFIIAMALLGWFVILPYLQNIKARRVEDHNTGAHIGPRGPGGVE